MFFYLGPFEHDLRTRSESLSDSRFGIGLYYAILFANIRTLLMLKKLKNFIFSKVQNEQYGLDNLDDDVIGYPPTPRGIPVVKTSVITTKMEEDVQFIKNELGLSDSDFERYVRPVTDKFIEFADLLPASEYKHHSTGGGLIYHSFDVAKRCVRASQLTQFPVTDVSQAKTQQSNRHWKTATVLTGLLHDSGKIITDVVVSDGNEDDPIVWDVYSGLTLFQWAKENQINRYFITYRNKRHAKHHNASVTMLQRIIPKETWSWLLGCEDGRAIHSAMLDCVSKANTTHPLCESVNYCDSESVKFDMLHRHSHVSKEVKRTPLSELLADLIKHHILKEEWSINQKGAKLWFVDDTTYLLWEACAPDLSSELIGAGYHIPESPDVLARICIEEGMCEAYDEDNLYYQIKPEILGTASKPITLNVIKFKRTARVVPYPEKLYSIKEHKQKNEVQKPEVVTKEENKKTTEDNSAVTGDEHIVLPPPPPSGANGYESSLTSLCRIASAIKGSLDLEKPEVSVDSQLSDVLGQGGLGCAEQEEIATCPETSQDVQSEHSESLKAIQGAHESSQMVHFEQPELQALVELGHPVVDGKIIIKSADSVQLSLELSKKLGFSPFFDVSNLDEVIVK